MAVKGPHDIIGRDDVKPSSSDSSSHSIDSDDVGNNDNTSSDGTSNKDEQSRSTDSSRREIAKTETNAVDILRLVVFVVLLMAAVSISVIVYLISTEGEESEFAGQYDGMVEQLNAAFDAIVTNKIGGIGSLRVALIAHSIDHIRTWPFVTLSSYPERTTSARHQSNAIKIGVYPIVKESDRLEWEKYVAEEGPSWIQHSFEYQTNLGFETYGSLSEDFNLSATTVPITYEDENGTRVDPGKGPYAPRWQVSPLLFSNINENVLKDPTHSEEMRLVAKSGSALIGKFITSSPGNSTQSRYARLLSFQKQKEVMYRGDPFTHIFLPVFRSMEADDRKTVAAIIATVQWASFFENILPASAKGIYLILENPCQGPFSYLIVGGEVQYLGAGDMHESQYNSMERISSFNYVEKVDDGTEFGIPLMNDYCPVTVKFYPSQVYVEETKSNRPLVSTAVVMIVFAFTAFMFLVYDRLVEYRQKLVLNRALQTSKIVESLFPKNVAARLLEQQEQNQKNNMTNNRRLKSFLSDENREKDSLLGQPIADLFPHTTVMFADVAGFTAWSSTREPSQVFVLLQTVYQAFDGVAQRRKVFKVETIGDSYVAVTGLPDPQPQHAVVMARFAIECQQKMSEITNDLAVTLGPGTSGLAMRIGLHSGPVTAGVLQGDKARFQLFGDTVNTAARMESTGTSNKIQVSSSTAALLVDAGKGSWISPRADVVHAKGKGTMTTFWLNTRSKKATSSNPTGSTEDDIADMLPNSQLSETKVDVEKERLIDWVCELLLAHIKKIIASRGAASSNSACIELVGKSESIPMDEVVEAIVLPEFEKCNMTPQNLNSVEIDDLVMTQLRNFISTIAGTYRDNSFHNFEHACHVTMSVSKLLMRVVNPSFESDESSSSEADLLSRLHDYTHGINSDPITLFAILFSAVIHDVDHRGVSNARLVQEEPMMANLYRTKSIAEQNSLDIAWGLLASEEYEHLRSCIFKTEEELLRFRQVIVNSVLATDIFDQELNNLRKQRWDRAFSEGSVSATNHERNNLRATIVIEHLMQASDVSHTMQHWQVYRKWNEKLFRELYVAFVAGRMGANPGDFWYQGELGFFDNYVIPLAKKLKDCSVFGVSSDEYLNYAERNRAEWEECGKEIVEEMMERIVATIPPEGTDCWEGE